MSIAASYKVPGLFLTMVFGVGSTSAADAPRVVAIVGQKGASGTFVADTPTLCLSPDDAAAGAGVGSELHLALVNALTVDPTGTFYAVALTPPSGGVVATQALAFTSGPSSADGTITIVIAGTSFDVFIPTGSTATAAGALVVAAIAALPNLPVVGVNTTGSVAINHKTKGTRGNQIQVSSSGLATGLTIAHLTGNLASGAGSDTLTTAQANMAPTRFHLIAVPHNVLGEIQSWRDHVNACAAPLEGRRQQVVAACIDTLSNAITLATGVNAVRVQVAWHYNGFDTTAQIAASVAARRALDEAIDPATPFAAQFGSIVAKLRPQPVIADRPLNSEIATALNNGLTPIAPLSDGTCAIARSVTSRSQDTTGAPNYAVFDTSKVTAPDFLGDQLNTAWPAFALVNKKLSSDPKFDENPVPGVATADSVKHWIYEQEKTLESAGILENVDTNFPNLVVTIPGTPAGRSVGSIPCDVPEGNYQADLTINQVG